MKRSCPAFLSNVCHCLEQAVLGQRVASGTACSKQWHTGGSLPGAARNWGYGIPILAAAVLLSLLSALVAEEDVKLKLRDEVIDGPAPGSNRAAWLAEMTRWRDAERKRIKYDPAQYARPELRWTQRSFVQPQIMVEERYFYDPIAGRVHGGPIP